MDCSCGAPWCDARNVCSAALIRDRRDPDGNRHVKGGRGGGDWQNAFSSWLNRQEEGIRAQWFRDVGIRPGATRSAGVWNS